jgi:hypothetical protein|tara:strand:- start:1554 stop:2588 length:1035 start_codon:yes stop_codon:yes gene_type:complete
LALAKRGNKVFYLNPPRILNSKLIDIKYIEYNLKTVDYSPTIRGTNCLPIFFRKHFHRYSAKNILDSLNESIDINWSFDPSSFQFMNSFRAHLNIFHPVDVHYHRFEKTIAKYADLIFASSDKILDRYGDLSIPKYKINHGLAEHFFNVGSKHFDFIKNPGRVNVGYVGNLHYQYLDTTILMKIIINHPQVDFYFIGPYKQSNIGRKQYNSKFIQCLKNMSNTFLIGPVKSDDLPLYLNKFDLFLMCYTGDRNISQLANPHKILEYLSTGKVIVTHYIDEYKNNDGLICMSNNNFDLPKLFTKVMSKLDYYNSNHKSHQRISFAKNNTYDKQLDRIELILQKYL